MAFRVLEEENQEKNPVLSFGKEAGRNLARTGSNLATRAIGLPGDVFSLINEYIANPVSQVAFGGEALPYEETLLGKVLPTTEKHRQNLEQGFGKSLRPENKIEKWADDIVEDTALLLNPANIAKKGIFAGSKIFRNLAKSVGANLSGETVKQVSESERAGAWTKAGALLMLSLLDQESAAKQVGKLYNEAEKHLPQDAKTSAVGLEKNLNSIETSITKNRPRGNLSPPEKFVVDQSDKIKNLIQNGEINVEQAMAQKRSLNKELSTLFKEVPKKSEQAGVKNIAKRLNGFLTETIGQYGKTNPKFFKPYKNAEQAFGTLAKSNFISHWVENNVVTSPITHGLLHMVGSPLAGGTAIAIAPYQAYKLSYRIARSPTLAKIYANTLKSAVKEDVVAFNKYLKDLDKGLQEEESEEKYRFID